MNRMLLLVLSTLVVAMLALGTASAFAEPHICIPDDPDCVPFPTPTPEPDPGPTTHPLSVHLFVTEPSGGTVTDTSAPTGQINCGAGGDDCGQVYTALVTCDSDDNCTSSGPPETLVASGFPLPGYTARFFACTSNAAGTTACTAGDPCDDGAGGCRLEMNQNWRVRVEWADTTAPTKPSISGPAKVGPAVHHFAGGGATDNTGVTGYRYFLDGVDQGVSATRLRRRRRVARRRHPPRQRTGARRRRQRVDQLGRLRVHRGPECRGLDHEPGRGRPLQGCSHVQLHPRCRCRRGRLPDARRRLGGDPRVRLLQLVHAPDRRRRGLQRPGHLHRRRGQPGHGDARVQARHGRPERRHHVADRGPAREVALHARVHRHRRWHGRRQPAEGVQAGDRRRLRRLRRAQRDRRPAHALGPRDRRGGQRARGDRRVRRRFDRPAVAITSGPPDDAIVTSPERELRLDGERPDAAARADLQARRRRRDAVRLPEDVLRPLGGQPHVHAGRHRRARQRDRRHARRVRQRGAPERRHHVGAGGRRRAADRSPPPSASRPRAAAR